MTAGQMIAVSFFVFVHGIGRIEFLRRARAE